MSLSCPNCGCQWTTTEAHIAREKIERQNQAAWYLARKIPLIGAPDAKAARHVVRTRLLSQGLIGKKDGQ